MLLKMMADSITETGTVPLETVTVALKTVTVALKTVNVAYFYVANKIKLVNDGVLAL